MQLMGWKIPSTEKTERLLCLEAFHPIPGTTYIRCAIVQKSFRFIIYRMRSLCPSSSTRPIYFSEVRMSTIAYSFQRNNWVSTTLLFHFYFTFLSEDFQLGSGYIVYIYLHTYSFGLEKINLGDYLIG